MLLRGCFLDRSRHAQLYLCIVGGSPRRKSGEEYGVAEAMQLAGIYPWLIDVSADVTGNALRNRALKKTRSWLGVNCSPETSKSSSVTGRDISVSSTLNHPFDYS